MEPDTKKLYEKIRALRLKYEELQKEKERPYKYSRKYNVCHIGRVGLFLKKW